MVYVNRIKKWSPARVEVATPKPQEIPAEYVKESVEESEKPRRGRKPKDEQ